MLDSLQTMSQRHNSSIISGTPPRHPGVGIVETPRKVNTLIKFNILSSAIKLFLNNFLRLFYRLIPFRHCSPASRTKCPIHLVPTTISNRLKFVLLNSSVKILEMINDTSCLPTDATG